MITKTATTVTDGAGNVYHGFQEEFIAQQKKVDGKNKIKEKRHCNNHEMHLMKDENEKALQTIIDSMIDLIGDLRKYIKNKDPLNTLIKNLNELSLELIKFDSNFKGRWISHARTEFRKLKYMMPAIFITLIEEVDKLLSFCLHCLI